MHEARLTWKARLSFMHRLDILTPINGLLLLNTLFFILVIPSQTSSWTNPPPPTTHRCSSPLQFGLALGFYPHKLPQPMRARLTELHLAGQRAVDVAADGYHPLVPRCR